MGNKTSTNPLYKAIGLFPAVLLLLFLQTGTVEPAPWYFLPTFGHDVRWVQGVADGYFATASRMGNWRTNKADIHKNTIFLEAP